MRITASAAAADRRAGQSDDLVGAMVVSVVVGVDPRKQSDHPMTDSNHGSDADAQTTEQQCDDDRVRSFTLDDQTVLYDVEDAERWIQSDTAVALGDAA